MGLPSPANTSHSVRSSTVDSSTVPAIRDVHLHAPILFNSVLSHLSAIVLSGLQNFCEDLAFSPSLEEKAALVITLDK